jgi:hypothetical protein
MRLSFFGLLRDVNKEQPEKEKVKHRRGSAHAVANTMSRYGRVHTDYIIDIIRLYLL